MTKTLYWHDYETTGVNAAFDRPTQFAGVRTDEDLNVVGEPLMLYCQPALDRLPHPRACLVTGLAPQTLSEKGLPEPAFAARVVGELARPGTCGVGYNSIRFDDEITRHLLYRNFFDPYEREWKNGNSRWDIIDMVRLTRALRPEGIEWPNYDDGTWSFRLEDLSNANRLQHEAAHDALSDVYATIDLARLVRKAQPRLYDYAFGLRDKRRVAALIDVRGQAPFLHVSSRLPRRNGYLGLMMPLCQHPTNSNAVVAINLSADPRPVLDLDAEALRDLMFTPSQELADEAVRPALKGVHLNRCPIVATPRLLDKAAAQRLHIDLDLCQRHWQQLRQRDISDKLEQVFSAREFAEQDVEGALYEGFIPDGDRKLAVQVRSQEAHELAAQDIEFSDRRYQELLFRYRARYAPDTLSAEEAERWRQLRGAWFDGREPNILGIQAYRTELDELSRDHTLSAAEQELLSSLREWGDQLAGVGAS